MVYNRYNRLSRFMCTTHTAFRQYSTYKSLHQECCRSYTVPVAASSHMVYVYKRYRQGVCSVIQQHPAVCSRYRSSIRIIQVSTSRRRVLKRVKSGGNRRSAPVIFTHNSSTWYIRTLKFECYTTTAGTAVSTLVK